jgi:hypothetical protein
MRYELSSTCTTLVSRVRSSCIIIIINNNNNNNNIIITQPFIIKQPATQSVTVGLCLFHIACPACEIQPSHAGWQALLLVLLLVFLPSPQRPCCRS